jgi:hypothetical protein
MNQIAVIIPNKKVDKILELLLNKKQDLLESLLVCSQKFNFVTVETELETLLKRRQEIFIQLQINDRCIDKRCEQLDVSGKFLYPEIISNFKRLLTIIAENNQQSIQNYEKEKIQLKLEKLKLNEGNKLSGYIYQQKAKVTFKSILSKK